MKKRKMKSGRRRFGKVFAFAVLFATLAFVIISVGIASSGTIQDAVSQPKIELFVDNTTTPVPIIDLLDAINQNMVGASFIGGEKNSVIINITNYADHGLEIKVPKGLILNSLDGSKSNMTAGKIFGMITTSPLPPAGWLVFIFYSPTSRIILDTNESKNYFISAYGVEFDKPTLGYKKEFSVGSINYDIKKIIETTDAFHSWDKSTDAIQSAIWCYTDDISKEELVNKREKVRDKEVLDAKTMLDLAGFETSSKKLFSEEIVIPTANIRERLEGDKVMIYVNKERESDKIGYKKAKEDYRWVILDVIIKNKMDEPLDFDVYDIKLRNNDNRIDVYDYSSYGTNKLDYAFKSTSAYPLPSNDTYRGEVAFEVPNNVSDLKMMFDIERFYGEIMLVDSLNPDMAPVSNFTPAYKIGEKAKDENIVITVNSKRETEIIKDQRAKENRTYLILNITIENIGTKNLSYSRYPFAVQDGNGYLFEDHYTTTYLENAFESGDLQPGQEYQGEISFEISKSSENLEMWYSPYSGPYIFVGLALPPPVPKTNVFVDKTERLFTSDTYIDHNQTYNFDREWGAGVWDIENLDNVTYTITTPIDLRYICTWETYQNGSEIGSTLPFNHTGENYTWVLPLKNRFASCIDFYLPEKTVQDNPWADVVVDTMNGDNYTWVNVTFIPRSPSISVDLTIKGKIIDFSYPPEFEEGEFFPDYSITFYGDWENVNQDKLYNFSILVDNPKEVELWLYETHGWDTEYNNTLTLPVSELGSVTVAYNVPVKWEYGSTQPRYTQGITIRLKR